MFVFLLSRELTKNLQLTVDMKLSHSCRTRSTRLLHSLGKNTVHLTGSPGTEMEMHISLTSVPKWVLLQVFYLKYFYNGF